MNEKIKLVLHKTFGGLKMSYYMRQLFFSALIAAIFIFLSYKSENSLSDFMQKLVLILINTFLYPYSRFVYESIVDFIVGDNQFWVKFSWFFLIKILMICLCWALAIFIAPIGLIFLYFYNNSMEKKIQTEENNNHK